MINGIYIIKDRLSGVAMDKPQIIINDACAVYGFTQFLENDKLVRKECYEIIRIGTYNDETFEMEPNIVPLATGKNAKDVLNEYIANSIGEE